VSTETRTSPELDAIAKALVEAQMRITGAKESGNNPHFRSSYATLEDIWAACREPLTSNGIAVLQFPGYDPGCDMVTLTTRLQHISGQWIEHTAGARPEKSGPQPYGSLTTYLKRYSLAAAVGVVTEDDDGNAGHEHTSVKASTNGHEAKPPPSKGKSGPMVDNGFLTRGKYQGQAITELPADYVEWMAGNPKASQQDRDTFATELERRIGGNPNHPEPPAAEDENQDSGFDPSAADPDIPF